MYGNLAHPELKLYGVFMENNYTVYMHTVVPTGKRYVGITRQNVKRRWGSNGCAYNKSQYFAKAILKYGWDNITHEILYTKLSKEEAEAKEIELIDKLNLTDCSKGYNIAKGGGGTLGVKASDETRQKLSISHKNGKKPSAIPVICLEFNEVYTSIGEAAEKTQCSKSGIRDCLSGRKNTTHGLHFDYARECDRKPKLCKMSKQECALIGSKKAMEVNRISVEQYDLQGNYIAEYSSMREAARFLGSNSTHISGCANGKRKTALGYVWKKKICIN